MRLHLCGRQIEVLDDCENVIRAIWWLALAIEQEPTRRWLEASRFGHPEDRQTAEEARGAVPERVLPPVPRFKPDLSRTPNVGERWDWCSAPCDPFLVERVEGSTVVIKWGNGGTGYTNLSSFVGPFICYRRLP